MIENRRGLSESQFREMQELLCGLTAEERRIPADPDFITEDEADIIFVMRQKNDRAYPLEQVLREDGLTLPRKL